MPIAIDINAGVFFDPASLAQLTNYAGLVAAVTRWTQDAPSGADAADFIRLAEARLRRLIVAPEMENTISILPSSASALPGDFDSARLLYMPGSPRRVIEQVSLSDLQSRPDTGGQPQVFAISGGAMLFSPAPDSIYSATLIYRASIPTLGPTTPTNWLLDRHPDVYLYAALTQAEFFGWNNERLPLIRSALDEAIDEINVQGRRKQYSGPLAMASPVHEAVGKSRYAFR